MQTDESRKRDAEKEFTSLVEKYHLADTLELNTASTMEQDRAMAAKAFANVDLVTFMDDLSTFAKKFSTEHISADVEAPPVSMKDLKLQGSEASATVVYSDETEQPADFVKSDGRWFLTTAKQLESSAGSGDTAEGASYGLSLIVTFDSRTSLKRATAKQLLQGVDYDKSMPATLEPTESPLQAKLEFMVPISRDADMTTSESIQDTIRRSPGVKDVQDSFAVKMEAAMKEFGKTLKEGLAQGGAGGPDFAPVERDRGESAADAPGLAATPSRPMPAADPKPHSISEMRDEPRALRFDGVKDSLVLSPIDWQALPAFTFEVWVRDWNGTIAGQGAAGDPENSIWLALGKANDKNQYPTSGWESNARNKQVRIGPVPTNRWVHFAMVFDGKNQSFYLDGQLKHRAAAPRLGPFDMRRSLGVGGGGSGSLRSVRVSSAARYRRNFRPAERWTPDNQTLLLLEAGNREGNILKDSSSQGNNALIRGAPVEVSGSR